VIVGVLLIVAGVILLVCWRRRCYGTKKKLTVGSLTIYEDTKDIENGSNEEPEKVEEIILPVASVTDIPVSSLPAYVRTELTKHEPFDDEFKVRKLQYYIFIDYIIY
jgi:hypothetical protein